MSTPKKELLRKGTVAGDSPIALTVPDKLAKASRLNRSRSVSATNDVRQKILDEVNKANEVKQKATAHSVDKHSTGDHSSKEEKNELTVESKWEGDEEGRKRSRDRVRDKRKSARRLESSVTPANDEKVLDRKSAPESAKVSKDKEKDKEKDKIDTEEIKKSDSSPATNSTKTTIAINEPTASIPPSAASLPNSPLYPRAKRRASFSLNFLRKDKEKDSTSDSSQEPSTASSSTAPSAAPSATSSTTSSTLSVPSGPSPASKLASPRFMVSPRWKSSKNDENEETEEKPRKKYKNKSLIKDKTKQQPNLSLLYKTGVPNHYGPLHFSQFQILSVQVAGSEVKFRHIKHDIKDWEVRFWLHEIDFMHTQLQNKFSVAYAGYSKKGAKEMSPEKLERFLEGVMFLDFVLNDDWFLNIIQFPIKKETLLRDSQINVNSESKM